MPGLHKLVDRATQPVVRVDLDERLGPVPLARVLGIHMVADVIGTNARKATRELFVLADDVLAGSALMFLICTYAIFFALRTRRSAVALLLEKIADVLFLLALTGMVACGFLLVYTIW